MHKLRVSIAVIFAVVITIGLLWLYRQPDQNSIIAHDPLAPFWQKLTVVAERFGRTPASSPSPSGNNDVVLPQPSNNGLSVVAGVHPDFVEGKIPLRDLFSVMKDHKIFGSTQGSLVLLQWCDFASVYCIESYEAGVLFSYLNAFPTELSYQLKPYPRDSQPGTILQHTAAACVEKNTTHETYLSFYFSLYQSRGSLTRDEILTLAERMNIQGVAECLDQGSLLALQQQMKRDRSLFGFTTLPANVLVNKKTGDYILIPGLYETRDVLRAMQWLLEKEQ